MTDVHAHFVALMFPIAQDEEKRSGIKPLITITQAAHESAWGTSGLTQKANNLFGFTGESWESAGKPVIKLPTDEYIGGVRKTVLRPFRAYGSWAESVRDWANLMQFPRYIDALAAARAGLVVAFAQRVAAAGYATDPHYADALINVAQAVAKVTPEMPGPLAGDPGKPELA